MNMPGFAADASLYPTSGHYVLRAGIADLAVTRIGLAQFLRPQPDGLPNGGFCHPGCGPCVEDTDFPTGCSRTCINAQCDDFTRQCTGCSHTTTCGPCTGSKTCCTGPFCQGVACTC
jgi:hypothetical protein